MTRPQLTPPAGVLVAIDVAKARNEVLIGDCQEFRVRAAD